MCKIWIYTYVHIYVSMNTVLMFSCIYTYVYVNVYVCMLTCTCIYTYMFICMREGMFWSKCMYTYAGELVCCTAHLLAGNNTQIHTTHTHTHTHTHTCIYVCICKCMCLCKCIFVCLHMQVSWFAAQLHADKNSVIGAGSLDRCVWVCMCVWGRDREWQKTETVCCVRKREALLYVSVCIHVCMHLCVCVCVRVFLCVCVCVSTFLICWLGDSLGLATIESIGDNNRFLWIFLDINRFLGFFCNISALEMGS